MILSAAIASLALVACNDGGSTDDGQDDGASESGSVESGTGIPPVEGCDLPVAIPQLDAPEDASTGFVRCNDGSIHRMTAVECAQPLPTGIACNGMSGSCDVDSDCTASPYGACLYTSGFISGCACTYGCASDADCGDGQICACGGSAPGYPASTQCIPADCVDDDACPESSCGLGHEVLGCGELWVTGCRTPEDTCVRSQDCANQDDNCLPVDGGAWSCVSPGVC